MADADVWESLTAEELNEVLLGVADTASATLETALRVASEAMKLLTPDQLAELRNRLDALEGGEGSECDDGASPGGSGG